MSLPNLRWHCSRSEKAKGSAEDAVDTLEIQHLMKPLGLEMVWQAHENWDTARRRHGYPHVSPETVDRHTMISDGIRIPAGPPFSSWIVLRCSSTAVVSSPATRWTPN